MDYTGRGRCAAQWDHFDYNVRSMPSFRVFRMKDSPRQQFRWAPHVSGPAVAKPKDFDPAGEVEALNEYDAWRVLRDAQTPLSIGQ